MFEKLSEEQRAVLEKKGKFVVKACPGSGKTYTVAAMLAKLLSNWKHRHRGIAVLSFTNAAWQEIKQTLQTDFEVQQPVGYPNFIGTIDSFVNQYIFLPFGHLLLNCGKRPTMVGEPFGSWHYRIGRSEQAYYKYFDKVSYGPDDKLVYPERPGTFFFQYSQIYKSDGTNSGHANNLIKTKEKFWKEGFANQKDANYWAVKIVERHQQIVNALSYRFPVLIIDEAQDTSETQMQILNILIKNGLNDLMLVGDPDQAIFEWNDARPQLFKDKYFDWSENSLVLDECYRSSQNICNFVFGLSELDNKAKAVNKNVMSINYSPQIIIYQNDNIQTIITAFIENCKNKNIEISPKNIAVLYRSDSFKNKIDNISYSRNFKIADVFPSNDYISYDFARAKYLIDNAHTKDGYKTIDKTLIKYHLTKSNPKNEETNKYIENTGFIKHRKEIQSILNKLPKTDIAIGQWIDAANDSLNKQGIQLRINNDYRNTSFEQLFKAKTPDTGLPHYMGTVHSVKGETFEAILLFLNKQGAKGNHYKTLIKDNVKPSENEELRIVYVGITRPRKILWLAVPDDVNKQSWESRLNCFQDNTQQET